MTTKAFPSGVHFTSADCRSMGDIGLGGACALPSSDGACCLTVRSTYNKSGTSMAFRPYVSDGVWCMWKSRQIVRCTWNNGRAFHPCESSRVFAGWIVVRNFSRRLCNGTDHFVCFHVDEYGLGNANLIRKLCYTWNRPRVVW